MAFSIQSIDNDSRAKIRPLFIESWGSDIMVTKGCIHRFDELDGFTATLNETIIGLLTFKETANTLEVVSLNSFDENKGVATALLKALIRYAQQNAISRLWLVTTNDNLTALKFYQKNNWTLTALYPNSVNEAREIKPSIPLLGNDGIAIRHELELVYEFPRETESVHDA